MNDNFGKYWQSSSMNHTIMVSIIEPGYTYDGKTFIEKDEGYNHWKYTATWIGGVYQSIEEFKENLDYIKDIYNIYLKHYKEDN